MTHLYQVINTKFPESTDLEVESEGKLLVETDGDGELRIVTKGGELITVRAKVTLHQNNLQIYHTEHKD